MSRLKANQRAICVQPKKRSLVSDGARAALSDDKALCIEHLLKRTNILAAVIQLIVCQKGRGSGADGIAPCFVELCEAVVAVNDVKRPSQFGQERDCLFPFRSERQARAAMPEVACKL